MEITLKIQIEVNGQPAGTYAVAVPQPEPEPVDLFFGQRPSEFLPNVRNVAGRATALLGLWHIDSHVSAYGRGWYGVVDNTTNEIKKPYLRGAAMVDDFIEAAVRLHLEAQKEPA